MSDLILERDGPVAILTLNRPQAMNALSRALRRDLAEALSALDADEATRVIILTGAGERAFSAGLDLKELGVDARALDGASGGTPDLDPVAAMGACGKPIIGAINGIAVTGGFELALACDVLIASTNARFADTHGRVGLMPGWGLSQKLSRLIGPYRAKELSLTGNFLEAARAESWGLVNRIVTPYELIPAARALAADMAQIEPGMLARLKRGIDDGYALALGAGLVLERERARAHNSNQSPAALEARRAEVLARGRSFGGAREK
jgi:enoyl-CoA hydratase